MIKLESEPKCGLELRWEAEPVKASGLKKSKKKKRRADIEPDSPLQEASPWC